MKEVINVRDITDGLTVIVESPVFVHDDELNGRTKQIQQFRIIQFDNVNDLNGWCSKHPNQNYQIVVISQKLEP
jgi:hypothetical protein